MERAWKDDSNHTKYSYAKLPLSSKYIIVCLIICCLILYTVGIFFLMLCFIYFQYNKQHIMALEDVKIESVEDIGSKYEL